MKSVHDIIKKLRNEFSFPWFEIKNLAEDPIKQFEKWMVNKERFKNKPIPGSVNWGRFSLSPEYFEFWQGRSHRLHDRIVYKKRKCNTWEVELYTPDHELIGC
jgi:pyridoxine/pyridoxamine 5'-phosphate oxidase